METKTKQSKEITPIDLMETMFFLSHYTSQACGFIHERIKEPVRAILELEERLKTATGKDRKYIKSKIQSIKKDIHKDSAMQRRMLDIQEYFAELVRETNVGDKERMDEMYLHIQDNVTDFCKITAKVDTMIEWMPACLVPTDKIIQNCVIVDSKIYKVITIKDIQ